MPPPTRTLTVRLHNSSGQPLPGLAVTVRQVDERGRPAADYTEDVTLLAIPTTLTTDEQGHAVFSLVPSAAKTFNRGYAFEAMFPDGRIVPLGPIQMPDEDTFLSTAMGAV
ncbi:MAG: hypothetical protein JJU22_03945 [Gammaproteobacteria bacterium]|nr:hypothetical protein [Gammaproteobacteria bacterium]